MTTQEMRRAVWTRARQCYAEKLFAGTSGNLSVYDREQDLMVITPTSVPYEDVAPEDMVVLRLDGEVLEGKYRPSSEWRMHAAVYENKPEISALIHTHSPYATAFAVNNRGIPVPMTGPSCSLQGAWSGDTPGSWPKVTSTATHQSGAIL